MFIVSDRLRKIVWKPEIFEYFDLIFVDRFFGVSENGVCWLIKKTKQKIFLFIISSAQVEPFFPSLSVVVMFVKWDSCLNPDSPASSRLYYYISSPHPTSPWHHNCWLSGKLVSSLGRTSRESHHVYNDHGTMTLCQHMIKKNRHQ